MCKITKGHEGIEWVKPSRLRSDLDLIGPINGVRGQQSKNSKRVLQGSEQEWIFPYLYGVSYLKVSLASVLNEIAYSTNIVATPPN